VSEVSGPGILGQFGHPFWKSGAYFLRFSDSLDSFFPAAFDDFTTRLRFAKVKDRQNRQNRPNRKDVPRQLCNSVRD
jgi:hypothetical protein